MSALSLVSTRSKSVHKYHTWRDSRPLQTSAHNDVLKDQHMMDAIWSMKQKCRVKKERHTNTRLAWQFMEDSKHMAWIIGRPLFPWSLGHPCIWCWHSASSMDDTHTHTHTHKVDFVFTHPQANVECAICIDTPKGFRVGSMDSNRSYVLQLIKNTCWSKQGDRVWNQRFHNRLIHKLGFTQSKTDDCVHFCGKTIFSVCVDDITLASADTGKMDQTLKGIEQLFDMTDKGNLADHLIVNIRKDDEGRFHLTQPHLIDQILKELNFYWWTRVINKEIRDEINELTKL